MNKEEYYQKKMEIEEQNKQNTPTTPTTPAVPEVITHEDILKMEQETEQKLTPEEKQQLNSNKPTQGKTMKDVDLKPVEEYPELCDILQTPEAMRLGTKARIPILLDVQGIKVRVYIRGLNTKEVNELQNDYDTEQQIDHAGVLMATTHKDGTPYTEEEILQLGYVNERRISAAIALASGGATSIDDLDFQEMVLEQFQK